MSRHTEPYAYLCAARVSDVLKMDWPQIMDKGIFIQQGKTGLSRSKRGQIACVRQSIFAGRGGKRGQ